jgi:hypothetical protein
VQQQANQGAGTLETQSRDPEHQKVGEPEAPQLASGKEKVMRGMIPI